MSVNQKFGFYTLGLVLLVGALVLLAPILSPFVIALLLAYVANPCVDKCETWRMGRTWAATLVLWLLVMMLLLAWLVLVPILFHQMRLLVLKLPVCLDWLQVAVVPWLQHHLGTPNVFDFAGVKKLFTSHWREAGSAMTMLLSVVTQSGKVLVTFILDLLLVPVVLFYCLRDWNKLLANLCSLLPRSIEPRVTALAVQCNEVLGAFFKGQLLVMLALATVYTFGLWLGGLQFALLIGIGAGLVSIVPYLGVAVGLLSACVVSLIQYQGAEHLWIVFVVFAIGQLLESMVLTPLLVGDRIGLHPVAVIFAILAGGQLFGFSGVLLALPAAAVLMVLIHFAREKYQASPLYQ